MAKGGKMQGGDISVGLNFVTNVTGKEEIARLGTQIKDIGKALTSLNNMSIGDRKALKYYEDEVGLIERATEQVKLFNRASNSWDNSRMVKAGTELLNIVNALRAKNSDSSFFTNMDSSVKDAIQNAKSLDGVMSEVLSTSKFSHIFEVFDTLHASMTDAGELIQRVFSGMDANAAIEQINYYKQAFTDAKIEIASLKDQLNEFNSMDIGNAMQQIEEYKHIIDNLEDRLETLKSQFAQTSVDKFASYLRSQNVISSEDMVNLQEGFDIGSGYAFNRTDVQNFINQIVEEIRAGTRDADAAIAEFKQTYHNLIEDSGGLSATDLSQITSAIESVSASARDLGEASSGVNASQLSELMSALGGTNVGSLPDLSAFIESLRQISELNFEGGIDSVRRLFAALQTDFSVSQSSLEKIGEGLKSITSDEFDPSKLAAISSLKFEGLNELKVSKAALSNLATYLPTISNEVNIANLQALSKINFSNLTKEGGLNISKSQMEGLAALTNKSDISSVITQLEQLGSKLDEIFNKMNSGGSGSKKEPFASLDIPAVRQKLESLGLSFDSITNKMHGIDDTELASKAADLESRLDELNESVMSGTMKFSDFTRVSKELKGDLSNLNKEISNFKGAEKIEESLRPLSALPEKLAPAQKSLNSFENQVKEALVEFAKADGTEAYKGLQNLAKGIEDARQKMGQMTKSDFDAWLNKEKVNFNELTQSLKNGGVQAQSFGAKLGNAMQQYAKMFTGTMAIMRVVQGFKQAVSATIELDTAMTQLKIVTKATDDELNAYTDTILKTANNTASAVTDVIDAMTTYARLGFSLSDSNILADLTAMLQNTGNVDASVAQDAITAISKGFNVGADQMEAAMDKIIRVGNNYAISVSQLSEGINNAGSMLAVAGNSFDQSLALLTASNTTIQNISKASTGLRTLAARIRNTTTELEDLGEEMTSSQYDELVKALTDARVALVNENNEFRSTYDILKDLSAVWNDLTSMQQAAISKTLAGKLVPVRTEMCA